MKRPLFFFGSLGNQLNNNNNNNNNQKLLITFYPKLKNYFIIHQSYDRHTKLIRKRLKLVFFVVVVVFRAYPFLLADGQETILQTHGRLFPVLFRFPDV